MGLTVILSERIRHAVKSNYANSSATKLIGCSIPEYRKYLESKFLPGMSWDNWNKTGWHIDHIKPCSEFDLTNEEEQKKCFHYSNTQPLWANDNLKHNQYSDAEEKKVLTNTPRNKRVMMTINANIELPFFLAKEIEERLQDKRVQTYCHTLNWRINEG